MRTYRRTTLIAVFCLAILAGLGLARRMDFNPGLLLPFFASPLLLVLRRKNLWSLYLVIILGLGLGAARGSMYMYKLHDLQSHANQKITVVGVATSDAVYGQNQQLDFTMSHVRVATSGHPLIGSFRVSGFGLNMVYRGDTVTATGKIYPTRGSYQADISYAQLGLVKPDNNWVNRFTRGFSTGMRNALPEPMASFALGLLIGQRSDLPTNIKTQLTMVGLVHIVAVSGYNVTILARAIARAKVRSRYQRLILSLGLIGVFILMTGFSASIIRAAIVSTLSLLAWYFGLKVRPMVLITLTSALTAYYNPFYVWRYLDDPGNHNFKPRWYAMALVVAAVVALIAVLAHPGQGKSATFKSKTTMWLAPPPSVKPHSWATLAVHFDRARNASTDIYVQMLFSPGTVVRQTKSALLDVDRIGPDARYDPNYLLDSSWLSSFVDVPDGKSVRYIDVFVPPATTGSWQLKFTYLDGGTPIRTVTRTIAVAP